jgi:hypothetical protein
VCVGWHDVVVAVGSWEGALGSDYAEGCARCCDVAVSILEGQERACLEAEDLRTVILGWLRRLARYSLGTGWARRRHVESEALGHVKLECAGWLTTLARRGL